MEILLYLITQVQTVKLNDIGAIEDVAILENKTDFGQFQPATLQTLFNGIDDNGKEFIFNDNSVRVFNGVEKDYTFKNDRVTFTSGQTIWTCCRNLYRLQ